MVIKLGGTENNRYIGFSFNSSEIFDEVRDWFSRNIPKEHGWMGWRQDKSSLTVFLNSEKSYVTAVLRWI